MLRPLRMLWPRMLGRRLRTAATPVATDPRAARPPLAPFCPKLFNGVLEASAQRPGGAHKYVLETWKRFGVHFDDINLAAALRMVARDAAQHEVQPPAARAAREARHPSPARRAQRLLSKPLAELLSGLVAQVASRLPALKPRELATVMHAASALAHEHEGARELVSAGAQHARALSSQLTPQGLCLVARACAKVDVHDAELMRAVSESARASSERFSSHDVSSLAWAFARLGVRDAPLFARLAQRARQQLETETVSPQMLANTAWAYARTGADAPQLFEQMSAHALRRVHEFKPFELVMLLWALAKAGRVHAPLFAAAAARLERSLDALPYESVSTAAWAYARADVRAEGLFRAIAAHAPARLGAYSAQARVTLAWAFCVSGIFPAELMAELARSLSALSVGSHTPVAFLQQLRQVDNALRLDAPQLGLQLRRGLIHGCEALMGADEQPTPTPSNLHLRISDTLRHMGVAHTNELLVPELGYFVDIALPERRLVLEANGTVWHGAGPPAAPDGRQLMKCRHLRAHGWRVLVVTDAEWDALGDSLVARREFLAERLAEASACEADRLACSQSRAPVIWLSEPADRDADGRRATLGPEDEARSVRGGTAGSTKDE